MERKIYLLWLLFISNGCFALTPENTSYYIPPSESRVNASLTNNSNEIAYVVFDISEIVNPRTKEVKDKKVDISKPDAPIVTTPSQVAIRPKSSFDFRIFSLDQSRDHDRYYSITPVQVYGTPLQMSGNKNKSESNGPTASLQMDVSIAMLVVVPKKNPTYRTKIVKENGLVISNEGDSVVLVTNLYACNATTDQCGSAMNYRLFPGETKDFCENCDVDTMVEFDLTEGINKQHYKVIIEE
ncbi:hypothetical protein [Vibrio nomapromontoriensis]|uniref:hypothetical protein n=1 Tax=Vibrio nomapromontoriensis TaxID=2910246 RepID=UPI003D0F5B68